MDRTNWSLGSRYRGRDFCEFYECSKDIHALARGMFSGLVRASLDFVQRCDVERLERRRAIHAEHPDTRMSPVILKATESASGVVLAWHKLRDSCRPGVEWPDGITTREIEVGSMNWAENRWLLRHAHEDEKELIIHHNRQVMWMREAWARFEDVRLTVHALEGWIMLPPRDF